MISTHALKLTSQTVRRVQWCLVSSVTIGSIWFSLCHWCTWSHIDTPFALVYCKFFCFMPYMLFSHPVGHAWWCRASCSWLIWSSFVSVELQVGFKNSDAQVRLRASLW